MRREVMNVLKAEFLPEFLNRIDETIIFHPLGMEELTKIVEIQLRRLQAQLTEAGITIRLTDEAKRRLAEEAFDPAYGARPMKRTIQQRMANPLASSLLGRDGRRERGWSRSAGTATTSPSRRSPAGSRRPESDAGRSEAGTGPARERLVVVETRRPLDRPPRSLAGAPLLDLELGLVDPVAAELLADAPPREAAVRRAAVDPAPVAFQDADAGRRARPARSARR